MRMPDGCVIKMRSDRKAVNVDLEMLELITCKNCKRAKEHPEFGGRLFCERHGNRLVKPDDWCSWAEKKERED